MLGTNDFIWIWAGGIRPQGFLITNLKTTPSKRLKTWCFRQNAVFHWIAFCVSCEDDVDFCSRKCLCAVCAKMWTTEEPLYLIRGFDLIGGWMQAVVNIVAIVAFGFVLLNNQDDPRRTLQNIAEHILWIPSFSKLNIAAHALSLKWIILWFVRWPDGVLQTPRLETKATLVWQEIYNFVCVGNGLTFGNGWSDKTVHKETLFW